MAMNFNLVKGCRNDGASVRCNGGDLTKSNQVDNGQIREEDAAADGTDNNICQRQYQQDLVARSHELSKRRFFEKLERESMRKNLEILGTQSGQAQVLRSTFMAARDGGERPCFVLQPPLPPPPPSADSIDTKSPSPDSALSRTNSTQSGRTPTVITTAVNEEAEEEVYSQPSRAPVKCSEQTQDQDRENPEPNNSAPQSEPTEVDLVILPTKHNLKNVGQLHAARRGPDEKYRNQTLSRPHGAARLHSSRHRCSSRYHRFDRLSRSISAGSGESSCSESSLEYLSLISTPGRPRRDELLENRARFSPKHSPPKRASSLSDELESLMSPSEFEPTHKFYEKKATIRQTRPSGDGVVRNSNKTLRSRISIDCVSPTGFETDGVEGAQREPSAKTGGCDTSKGKSRSLLRWFGNSTNSTHSRASNSPGPRASKFNSPDYTRTIRCSPHQVISNRAQGETVRERDEGRHHSMNGFLSLIDRSHANGIQRSEKELRVYEATGPSSLNPTRVKHKPSGATTISSNKLNCRRCSQAFLNESGAANEENQAEDSFEEVGARCQSLNIYQSLMRNYVKKQHHRRHHNSGHHGHHCHHNHHNHHHQHSQTTSNYHHKQQTCCQLSGSGRHAQSSSTRCGAPPQTIRACVSLDYSSSLNSKVLTAACKRHSDKSSVWGQLIKINKSDGSQVIELQRAPNKSWGFFVARGAINNIKGIFISRMHDDATSSSLAGLLSIGDRILSIDNCSLEPDFDILRVNQMISKKSKILLRVRPFKG